MTSLALPSNGVKSVPLWLGSPQRPLFSWLDLPDDGLVAGAAVLCPTMGLESEYSARALRDLARRLAASGWAALRVDYAGMGDSAGIWTDPDLVTEWLDGVRSAMAHARALGSPRVALVGLRIGATVAAAEAARGGEADDLVLWDPSVTGRAFLREQRALWRFLRDQATEWGTLREGEAWGPSGTIDDGSLEAPGVIFSAATISELEPLAIGPSDRGLATRELMLVRQGRKLPGPLKERLALAHVESAEIEGQEALLDVSALTPESTLDKIVSWLTEPRGPVVGLELPKRPASALHRTNGRPAVLERTLEIGPVGLFGLVSEPENHLDPSAPTVLFLNAGRIGHHGPARLWVDLARSWAAEGARCVRVDLSGIGDSPTRPGRTELVEFPADALEDLEDVRRALCVEPDSKVILVGLCSGGYHAVESALAAPTASVCVVNPALTYYRGWQHPYRRFEPNQAQEFSDRAAWGSTRPWLSSAMVLIDPLRGVVRSIPGGWWVLKRLLVTASPARTFQRLTQSGVDVLVVSGSVEEDELCRGERHRIRALIRGGRLRFETVPHLEHTLLERTGRDRVSELLHAHVTRHAREVAGPASQDAVR